MRIRTRGGTDAELRVTGYQFPNAEDPRQRYSWHVVAGAVRCDEGTWTFSYPALTCGETPQIGDWLRRAAAWFEDGPEPSSLTFTEPNLAFAVIEGQRSKEPALRVEFDLEFKPPWIATRGAGQPYAVQLHPTAEGLRNAAHEWDSETARFPDRSSEADD